MLSIKMKLSVNRKKKAHDSSSRPWSCSASDSHPHGGEGRSGVGMKHPKTVYGKSAVGNTETKKYSIA